jgi:hypothetical protein
VISVGVFLPWLLAVGHAYAAYDPWGVWFREILQNSTAVSNNPSQDPSELHKTVFYYLQFFGWVAPHTPAFVAALALPFLTRKLPLTEAPHPAERRARWAFWLIVVVGLLFISCLAEKKPRYGLPLFPFAGLLCASVWLDFSRLPKDRKVDLLGKFLLLAQALFFIVPALGGIVAMVWSNIGTLPEWMGGAAVSETLHSLPPAISFVLLMLTLVAGIYYWRLLWQGEFTLSLVMLGVTSWLLLFTVQCLYHGDPSTHTNPARHPAEEASVVAGADLVYTNRAFRPWLSTLYYANRELPEEDLGTLESLANNAPGEPFFFMLIIGNNRVGLERDPAAAGFVDSFESATHRQADLITTWDDEERITALYRFGAASATTATRP